MVTNWLRNWNKYALIIKHYNISYCKTALQSIRTSTNIDNYQLITANRNGIKHTKGTLDGVDFKLGKWFTAKKL